MQEIVRERLERERQEEREEEQALRRKWDMQLAKRKPLEPVKRASSWEEEQALRRRWDEAVKRAAGWPVNFENCALALSLHLETVQLVQMKVERIITCCTVSGFYLGVCVWPDDRWTGQRDPDACHCKDYDAMLVLSVGCAVAMRNLEIALIDMYFEMEPSRIRNTARGGGGISPHSPLTWFFYVCVD
jgi:hypothetical protein